MKLFITLSCLFLFNLGLFAQGVPSFEENFILDYDKFPHPQNIDKIIVDEIIWLQDSTYSYAGNSDNEWDLRSRTVTLLRDENENPLLDFSHFRNEDENSWSTKDSTVYTYHDAATVNTAIRWPWNSETNTWADTAYYEKLNEKGNPLEIYYKGWSSQNNVFSFGFKFLYSYDENDNQTQLLYLSWDLATTTWVNNQLTLYTHDENDILTESIVKTWDIDINDWVDYNRRTYTYDEDNNLLEALTENAPPAWAPKIKRTYTYDENGLRTNRLTQSYDNNTLDWINDRQISYIYDVNGNSLTNLQQKWSTIINDWENQLQFSFMYDENENLIEQVRLQWNDGINDWLKSSKLVFFWSEYDIVNTKNIAFISSKAFPNPTAGIINISSNVTLENTTADIYTFSGQLLRTIPFTNQNTLDISHLPNGVYFIHVLTKEGRLIKKIEKI